MMLKGITAIPGAAEHMEGVINVRGEVVPLLSLRSMTGSPQCAHDKETRVLILDCHPPLGLIVDMVGEVKSIAGTAIEPMPSIANATGINKPVQRNRKTTGQDDHPHGPEKNISIVPMRPPLKERQNACWRQQHRPQDTTATVIHCSHAHRRDARAATSAARHPRTTLMSPRTALRSSPNSRWTRYP